MARLEHLQHEIERTMLRQRRRLRQRLDRLRRLDPAAPQFAAEQERLAREIERSVQECEQRRSRLPAVRFEGDLPILAHRDEIAAAIVAHPVVIVCGETGSGKSTQLPKICLSLGRGAAGLIGHTQPRRIAARAIAARVAEELGVALGHEVGFKTRFADATSPQTCVKVMTDGILLAESLHDRFLERYDTLILDEAHERSLNIDFLLGYIKRILPQRPELKLIITSATIEVARFSRHFASGGRPAPVVAVSGRTYPVEIRYRPIEPDEDTGQPDPQRAVLDAVAELSAIDRGDILVFMPTERDIHEASRGLRGRLRSADDDSEILPLYARLPDREHARVFQPHGRRRIVIATNVAESALTVPGVRYVIDTGTARISRYSARSQTQRLPIEPISRASADQRAGRCGRTAPGVCIRLYAEEDYLARDAYTLPEIQRTNLAAVILQAKAMRLGEIEGYPFLDPPRPGAVRDGYRTLFELGAIDDGQRLTPLGERLARLPVDPRIGRMILAAAEEGCLADALIIASILELQDPRERPYEKREAADQAHAPLADPQSDFVSYLKLWDFYHGLKAKLSRSQLRNACAQNFLSNGRMAEWLEIHRQLQRLAGDAGLSHQRRRLPNDDEEAAAAAWAALHRAILAGLLGNVALRGEGYDYTAAGGRKCRLWPGSGLFKTNPAWIMAAESVETTQRYLRTCARIDPAWIEPLAEHLVERSYSDPYWDRKSGSAMAYEKVTLFGLPVVPRRRMALGPADPDRARLLLIESGLVGGEIELRADFLAHNLRLRAEVDQWQRKLRRNDLFLGDSACCAFYDQRIPADVYDVARLKQWLRTLDAAAAGRLCMTPADLAREDLGAVVAAGFPDEFGAGRLRLPLRYEFAPGAADDGVTLVVPVEALSQLEPEALFWLVPGLLEAKLVALMRALPKALRTHFVPIPEAAQRALPAMRFGHGTLLGQLAATLGRMAGTAVAPDAFQLDKLPAELAMNIRVTDAQGKTLAEGRDLVALRRQLGVATAAGLATAGESPWHRDGITAWDFEALPTEVEVRRQGVVLMAYPALVDLGTAAGLRLFDSPARAALLTRGGLRRLYAIACRDALAKQVQWLPDLPKWLVCATLLDRCDLKTALAELLADRALLGEQPLPRTRAEFEARLADARPQIAAAVQEIAPVAGAAIEGFHRARLALDKLCGEKGDRRHLPERPEGCFAQMAPVTFLPKHRTAADDVAAQLGRLTAPGFLAATPWPWLKRFGCYFRAVEARLERLAAGDVRRDAELMAEVLAWQRPFDQRAAEHEARGLYDPELALFRWMLEEFRVSLFAQRLGTALPVSAKRLERQWAKVQE